MTDLPEAGVKLVAETDEAMSAIDSLAGELDSVTSGSYLVTLETEVDTSAIDSSDIPTEDDTVTTTVDVEETDTSKETLNALNVLKNAKIIETVWNIAGTAVNLFQQFGGQILQPMIDLDSAVAHLNATTGSAIPNARELIKNIFYDDLGESIGQVADLVAQAHQIGAPIEEATRATLTFTHAFTDQNPQTVLQTLDQLVQNKLAPDFKTASDLITVGFQNGANRGGDLLQALNENAVAIHDLGITGPQALSLIKTGLDHGFTSADQVVKALEKIKQNVTQAAGNATSNVSQTLKILGIANPAETGEAWSADFFKKVINGIKNQPGLSDTERETLFSNLIGGKQGGKTFSAFLALSTDEADKIFAEVPGAAQRAAKEADNSIQGAINDFQLAVQKSVQDFLSSSQIDIPGKINLLKQGLQNALDTLAKGGTLGEALTVALKPIGFDDEFQGLESALGNFVIGILQAVADIQDLTGHGKEAAGTRTAIANIGAQQLAFDLKIANPDDVATSIQTAVSRGVTPQQITSSVSTAVNELIASGATEQAQLVLDSLKTQGGVGLKLLGFGANATAEVKKQLEDAGLGTVNPDGTVSLTIKPGMSIEDQTKMATDLAASLENQFGLSVMPINQVVLSPEALASLQKQISGAAHEKTLNTKDADLSGPIDAAAKSAKEAVPVIQSQADTTTTLTNNVTPAAEAIQQQADTTQTLGDNAQPAATNIQKQADATKEVTDNANAATPKVSDLAGSMDSVGGSAGQLTITMGGLATAIQQVLDKVGSLGTAADNVAKKQAAADAAAPANPDSGAGPHAAGGQFTGTGIVGDAGPEVVSSNTGLAVLNNMTTRNLIAALQSYIPGGSLVGRGGGNNYTAINNNIVQSEAQADALGYRTAETLRGMANS